MSTTNDSESAPQRSGTPEPAVKQPRSRGRRRVLVGGALVLLLAVVVGGIIAVRYGYWKPGATQVKLPEIPTVSLDGADPAIAKIVREAREHLEQSPQIAFGWGQYAMVLQAHGFADAAHVCYDAAALLDPKNPLWPYLQGDLYYSGPGGPGAALPYFEAAAKISPPESLPQIRVAGALLDLGRLDEAEREFSKVTAIRKDDPQARLGLGKLAVARRQYRDALQYLQPVSENPLVRNAACTMLATVYDRLGDQANAASMRERLAKMPADQLRADDPIILVMQLEVGVGPELTRAEKLRDQKKIPEMMAVLEEAVHRYPNSYEAWVALSDAYEMMGDGPGAVRAARRIVKLAPKNGDAWLNLANVLIWQRRYQEALEPLQKSIELNPKKSLAYFALGECRKGLGDFAGAEEAYKLAGMEQASPQKPTPEVKEAEPPPALTKYAPVISFYYTNPQPEQAKQMLVDLIRPENLDDPWYKDREFVLQLMAASLGDIGYGQADLVRFFESKFAGAPDVGKRIILRALQTCGDKITQQVVELWLAEEANAGVKTELTALKEHLASPQRKRSRDMEVQGPLDIDFLWGDFFATGEFPPVARILDVFDLPNTPANAQLKQAAQGSVISNFQQHPKLVEIVKEHLETRPEGSKAVVTEILKRLTKVEAEKQK